MWYSLGKESEAILLNINHSETNSPQVSKIFSSSYNLTDAEDSYYSKIYFSGTLKRVEPSALELRLKPDQIIASKDIWETCWTMAALGKNMQFN